MDIEYLVDKYSKLVYKICYDMLSNRLDAEDATQEVYINLYRSLNKYEKLNENELKNLICKIALNKCKDILKSKMNKINNMTEYDLNELEKYESDNNIEEELYEKERKLYIVRTINEINEPYKSILYDYYINQYSLDEISKYKNINKSTLKIQIYRGKKILQEKIKVSGGDNFL